MPSTTTTVCAALAAAAALPWSSAAPSNLLWNTSLAEFKQDLVDIKFGWGKLYVSTTAQAIFLDNNTGKVLESYELDDYGCYIWTSRASVIPLEQEDSAVEARNGYLEGFKGMNHNHSLWKTTPDFQCPYLDSVSSRAVVATNFTHYAFASTENGDMWTEQFCTYDNQATGNLYLIEPTTGNDTFALLTVWSDDNEGGVNTTMFNAVTGDVQWKNQSDIVTWFSYEPVNDVLIENNLPSILRARDWRDWNKSPLWSLDVSTANFGAYTVDDSGRLIVFDDGSGGVEAYDVKTAKQEWKVNGHVLLNTKSANIVTGSEYFYHVYSIDDGQDYLDVVVEKRKLDGGTDVWTHKNVAKVKYGWIHAQLSEDETILYLWSTIDASWVSAFDVR